MSLTHFDSQPYPLRFVVQAFDAPQTAGKGLADKPDQMPKVFDSLKGQPTQVLVKLRPHMNDHVHILDCIRIVHIDGVWGLGGTLCGSVFDCADEEPHC